MKRIVFIAAWLLVIAIVAWLAREDGARSYHAVGLNDGSILARMDVIRNIEQAGVPIGHCRDHDHASLRKIVELKSRAIYARPRGTDGIVLCEYD